MWQQNQNATKCTWIGKWRVPNLLFASDGSAVPMMNNGSFLRSVICEAVMDFCAKLTVYAIALLMIWTLWGMCIAHAETAPITGKASWYSSKDTCRFNPHKGCPTASGVSIYELEKMGEAFAAAWDLPFGTRLRVVNQNNGRSVVVTIKDRGPNRRLNRVIDLSKSAFKEIASVKDGVIPVTAEVLS